MVTLLILDGYGIGEENEFNAIYKNSKNMKKLCGSFPSAMLLASGEAVGLSAGQMGNSETGHLNIGAGRVVYQDLTRIDNLIKDNSLKNSEVFAKMKEHIKSTKGKVHLMGLLSDGGVHSHIEHLKYLLKTLNRQRLPLVLHCFLDGRDTKVDSGLGFLREIEGFILENKINCEIADIVGRVYAMDREKRFDRVEMAYNLLTGGKYEEKYAGSVNEVENLEVALEKSYENGIFDEFVLPTKKAGTSFIEDGDAILAFNFRTDRMREIISAFGDKRFKEFGVKKFKNLFIATMAEYDKTFRFANVILKPEKIKNGLSEVLSKHGKKQFRISETTKYAHITHFFNGGIEKAFDGEERVLIDSINTQDFSAYPKMRAKEITKGAISAINSKNYDFILINLSNADMLGHTGNLKQTKKAIRCVDDCLFKIAKASLKAGGDLIITADHGNAEKMADESGVKMTAHTTNPVPVVLVSERYKNARLKDGRLADLAPTILSLMGIKVPKEMTGENLVRGE